MKFNRFFLILFLFPCIAYGMQSAKEHCSENLVGLANAYEKLKTTKWEDIANLVIDTFKCSHEPCSKRENALYIFEVLHNLAKSEQEVIFDIKKAPYIEALSLKCGDL